MKKVRDLHLADPAMGQRSLTDFSLVLVRSC